MEKMIKLTVIQPGHESHSEVFINPGQCIIAGKFPVLIQKTNAFTREPVIDMEQPPEGYYTCIMNSQHLPSVFVNEEDFNQYFL